MKDFILNLYNNEHFVLYLTIALVVLVVLFVIVLFLGRKDKKLQETKKLEKLNVTDTFKEEKTENKIEVKETQNNEEIKEENLVPNMDGVMEEEAPTIDNNDLVNNEVEEQTDEPTIVLPVVDDVAPVEPTVAPMPYVPASPMPTVEPVTPDTPIEPPVTPETIPDTNDATMIEVEPQVNEMPESHENTPANVEIPDDNNELEIQNMNFDEINNSLEKELTELENLKKQFNDIELPDSNLKEVEVPGLKEEVKEETKPFQPSPQIFSSVFVDKSEDEFELPTLKKSEEEQSEKEEEKPVEEFNTSAFRFDEINGETYNLNNK